MTNEDLDAARDGVAELLYEVTGSPALASQLAYSLFRLREEYYDERDLDE